MRITYLFISLMVVLSSSLILFACQSNLAAPKAKTKATLQQYLALSQHKIDTNEVILINAIHPRDCMNCYIRVNQHLEWLQEQTDIPQSNLLFLLPKLRKIEQRKLFAETTPIDMDNYTLVKNEALWQTFFEEAEGVIPSSSLFVYSPKQELLYAKEFRKLPLFSKIEELYQH